MQPAFRSIFRCYLLSPFVTLSAGGVGLSFKNAAFQPRLYDQGNPTPEGESHTVASFTSTFCDVDFAIDHPKFW
jgi:hypothetical protein